MRRKKHTSKTQKLMNPIYSIFLYASQLWEENYVLPTVFQAGCLGVSMHMYSIHVWYIVGTQRNFEKLDWTRMVWMVLF